MKNSNLINNNSSNNNKDKNNREEDNNNNSSNNININNPILQPQITTRSLAKMLVIIKEINKNYTTTKC